MQQFNTHAGSHIINTLAPVQIPVQLIADALLSHEQVSRCLSSASHILLSAGFSVLVKAEQNAASWSGKYLEVRNQAGREYALVTGFQGSPPVSDTG